MYYVSYLIFPEKNLEVKERNLAFEEMADELDRKEMSGTMYWNEGYDDASGVKGPENFDEKPLQEDSDKGGPHMYVLPAK
nr:uncharacterized protein I203_08234 [Kwoniella mangroviensis CBS 8507]OCF62659.1 hypothetical protein I203_08234 [Kwoniella mangroviensis CBS 8507]